MHPHRKKLIAVCLSCLVWAGMATHAAEISTQSKKGFQRVIFSFDTPTRLNLENNGSNVVLQFDHALKESPSSIQARLAGYVTSAKSSGDGKRITLTMSKPYRIRQFVSGNGVGIDIIGDPGESAPTLSAAEPQKAEAPKHEEVPAATTVKAKPIAPKVAAAEPKKKPAETVKAPAPPETMLSTKPEEQPTVEAIAPAPVLTTKAEIPPAPAPVPEKPAEKKPEPTPSIPAEIPFVVSAQKLDTGIKLNFPWKERTAAAVFERARDIWIIFSRPVDVKVPLLRGLMPKQVVDVTQYAYPGNTVLRITTDGTLHAGAEAIKGSYAWDIGLTSGKFQPSLEVAVAPEGKGQERHLLLGAFDIATPVRFYDPRIGDLMLAVPAYESGRGVANEKKFPELTILKSSQGIAITSAREDIKTESTRAGFSILAPGGLAVSENLPVLLANAKPVPGVSAAADVLLPYDQWYVSADQFKDVLAMRLRAAASASADAKPDSLLALVTLYLGQGMAPEAHGYLVMLQQQYPDYYAAHKLALLDAASNVLLDHISDAAERLAVPELANVAEAELWREVVNLHRPETSTTQKIQQQLDQEISPTPPPPPTTTDESDADGADATFQQLLHPPAPVEKPAFHFLKFNKPFIRFYPPRIRQHLAIIAADAYEDNELQEKALAVFDTLNRDGILEPVKLNAEYALGAVAVKKNQTSQAMEIFERLAKQTADRYIQAKARYALAMLKLSKGTATAEETANTLENIRIGWRGDRLEHRVLTSLAQIYKDTKQYDATLRSWKAILEAFPNDPETLKISAEMSELFQNLFLNNWADDMPPLKSLSLFYEFRDLTPVGDKGDEIIQSLADRLAAFDLLDRATQLLEHQIKFRVSGETRSRVGARLALLYLLNHQPREALDVLQITNFGANNAELQRQRQQLAAQALNTLGKHEEALSMIYNDTSQTGAMLRLDILWSMKDWPNVINRAEDILAARPNLTAGLTPLETEVLLKLALGYSFEADYTQLRYLRDYYMGLIPDTAYKEIFSFITNDTTPLDAEDFALIAQQISHTESFLGTFKAKIAAGKLSEAIK